MAKYIKKKALKKAIDCCTWYHINKNGELVEGANPAEHEPLYKYSDIKKIIKGLPTRKFDDEPTAEDSSEVEWVYNKRERLWYPYSNGELLFKDKPTTQTETQNSNLTFEKDECAKEYEELGLKELKELIEADRKDEFFREPTAEERKAVADYIDSISVPTGVNIFDLMDEPQTDCSWK